MNLNATPTVYLGQPAITLTPGTGLPCITIPLVPQDHGAPKAARDVLLHDPGTDPLQGEHHVLSLDANGDPTSDRVAEWFGGAVHSTRTAREPERDRTVYQDELVEVPLVLDLGWWRRWAHLIVGAWTAQRLGEAGDARRNALFHVPLDRQDVPRRRQDLLRLYEAKKALENGQAPADLLDFARFYADLDGAV